MSFRYRPRELYIPSWLGAGPQAAYPGSNVAGHDGLVQNAIECVRRESGTPGTA